jgi:hypothetical protein
MGGNAIEKARRVSKQEYEKIIAHIEGQGFYTTLISGYKNFYGKVVKSYRNKEDFGDIDVVIDDRVDIVPIFAHFRPKKCAVNGHVMSFSYDGIQVDFIRVPAKDIRSTLDYFAYNDLGNLLGKIARGLGLKYGSKGLIYQYKDEREGVIEDIIVTKELTEILTHLGLDPKRYEQGFDNLEDIFEYVASSKHFDPYLYSLSEARQKDRNRDSKRKTYIAFLEWIGQRKFPIRHLPVLKDMNRDAILRNYPHVQERIAQLDKERCMDKKFRERFNGEVVSRLTRFNGTLLGQFMEYFRTKWRKEILMQLTESELHNAICMARDEFAKY